MMRQKIGDVLAVGINAFAAIINWHSNPYLAAANASVVAGLFVLVIYRSNERAK